MSLLPSPAGGDYITTDDDDMTVDGGDMVEHLLTKRPSIDRASLHTDGGSRGNPGASGIGFTLTVDDGRELVTLCRGGAYIGTATNNVAEYRALIWGLRNALALKVQKIDIYADSELLVKQLLGTYRVKNAGIKPLFSEAQQLLAGFELYQVQHVPREQNSAADELANEAMDTRGMVGDFAVDYEASDLFSLALSAPGEQEATSTAPAVSDTNAAPAAPAAPATPAESAAPAAPTASAESAAPAAPTAPATAPGGQKAARSAPDTSRKGNVMTDMGATGIYTLTIKEHFDAAHALIGYPGQCKNLHGHTWDVEVSVRGTELDEVGIVYDFKDLKNNLWGILEQYDHVYLNEVPPFDAINATAENLARVIYEQLAETLPEGVELVEVAVWESPIAKLTYSR